MSISSTCQLTLNNYNPKTVVYVRLAFKRVRKMEQYFMQEVAYVIVIAKGMLFSRNL